jgi:hypothetical protein
MSKSIEGTYAMGDVDPFSTGFFGAGFGAAGFGAEAPAWGAADPCFFAFTRAR